MSLPPNIDDIAQGKNGGLLCGIVPANWSGGNPPFSGDDITLAQLVYIGVAIQEWQFEGNVTARYIGPDPAPTPASYTATFGDSTYIPGQWTFAGAVDENPSYLKQFSGLTTYSNQAVDTGNGQAGVESNPGFPPINGLQIGRQQDTIYLNDNKLYLGPFSMLVGLGVGTGGAATSDPQYELTGAVDSGITFDIAGVSQTLWNINATQWSLAGTLTLKPKTYWTCGGAYDSETGKHT